MQAIVELARASERTRSRLRRQRKRDQAIQTRQSAAGDPADVTVQAVLRHIALELAEHQARQDERQALIDQAQVAIDTFQRLVDAQQARLDESILAATKAQAAYRRGDRQRGSFGRPGSRTRNARAHPRAI
jgi:hypothetical protein